MDAWVSRISTQKPRLTIPAAIGSQAKKWENGVLQEVLPVRRSHIRTMTLRAGACSPHKTTSILSLCRARKKYKEKMCNCLGSQPNRRDPLSTAKGNSTLLRASLTRQPAKCQLSPSGRVPRTITLLSAIPKHIVYAVNHTQVSRNN